MPINTVLAVAGTAVGSFLAVYVAIKSKAYKDEIQQNNNSPDEQMRLVRGVRQEYGTVV